MIKFSLFARIALSLGAILTTAMLALGYVIIEDAEKGFQQERLQLVTAGAKTLAQGSLDALVSGDFELLERWVDSVLLADYFAYAYLARPSGQILTHTDPEMVARLTEPVNTTDGQPAVRMVDYQRTRVREVVYPAILGDQHLANAHVGYYADREAMAPLRENTKIALLIGGSLLLMLIATLYILRWHTRPIQRLTDHVTQLSLEKGYTPLPRELTASDDEVGLLSRAFDAMTKRLLKAFDEQRNEEERLRERVDERTAELQRSNREMESFSYSVSHDLRAPLRAVDGFSAALMEDCADKLDDDDLQMLRRIRAAAQRMGRLIDDMLELSRVSRSVLKADHTDLGRIAREVCEELQQAEPARRVDWRVGEDLFARGDRRLLRIVLTNLIGNAWKYTGKLDRAEIEVGRTMQGGEPVFFVRDNGCGFDMAYVDNLFKPFSRLHGQGEFEGTGIGLATVQRIIERHHGRVWAEAVPGEGATFYFNLGLAARHETRELLSTAGS